MFYVVVIIMFFMCFERKTLQPFKDRDAGAVGSVALSGVLCHITGECTWPFSSLVAPFLARSLAGVALGAAEFSNALLS